MNGWQPSHLTAGQKEERRLAAARLFRAGRLKPSEIAQRLGVSRAAVSQWRRAWRTGGDPRLKARSTGHRPARLTAAEWRGLGRILDRGAVASGFETEQWTLKRIAHVIERAFGVSYHYRYLERPLKAQGYSMQRPASRARERDEQLVAEWLLHTWPALKKKGAAGRANDRIVGRDRTQLSDPNEQDLGPSWRDPSDPSPEWSA